MTVQSPPYALQAGSHSAQLFRQALSTLLGSAGGIVGSGDLAVTQNGTPNMSVNVAGGVPGGQIWVPGTTSAGVQGLYYGWNDGTVNLAVAASNPSNPRIDIAVAQVQDAAYTGATNSFQLAIVTGTPAGSPVAPSAPASSLVLANIAVAALATTVVTGNITDQRARATVTLPLGTGVVTSTMLAAQSVTNAKLDQTTVTPQLGLSDGTAVRRGKSIIATTETLTTPAAYTLAPTPDRVQNLVVPQDSLIAIAFTGRWSNSVAQAGKAAIFIGANQLQVKYLGANQVQAAWQPVSVAGQLCSLMTGAGGLVSGGNGSAQADVTTGQSLGCIGSTATATGFDIGDGAAQVGAQNLIGSGEPIYVFLAAGTYDITVKYKASSGNVTVQERKLWVWTVGF